MKDSTLDGFLNIYGKKHMISQLDILEKKKLSSIYTNC